MLHIRVFLIGSPWIDVNKFYTYLFTYIFFKDSGKNLYKKDSRLLLIYYTNYCAYIKFTH